MKEIWKWLLAGLVVILGSVIFLTVAIGFALILGYLLIILATFLAPYIPNLFPQVLGWIVLIGITLFSFVLIVGIVKKEFIDRRIK